MAEEVPLHDQKFPDVTETLEIAEATAKKLSDKTGLQEQDVPQRQNDYENVNDRWEEAKKRLNKRLGDLRERIPIVQKSKIALYCTLVSFGILFSI